MENTSPEELNSYALALYNYKLFERFRRTADYSNETYTDLLSLKEICEFIETNFEHLHNKKNLFNILPILHYTINLERRPDVSHIDIDKFFFNLLNKYVDREKDQQVVLQILFQVLKSMKEDDPRWEDMSAQLFHLFCKLLFKSSKLLASNILSCLQLHINKFKRNSLYELFWDEVVKVRGKANLRHRLAQILAHLIDALLQFKNDFYKNKHLIEITQILLVSHIREERKTGIYLLKKMLPLIVSRAKDVPSWELDRSSELCYSWTAYITVLENLEEKQSHLILPTLNTIKNINLNKIWHDLLYKQMLQHNNILVLRWAVEYILSNFKCKDLSQELLQQFLTAANHTNLYNYNNYCIPNDKVDQFLNCDLSTYLVTFEKINWKSLPLNFWLRHTSVDLTKLCKITLQTLINIAARVRVLQNTKLRQNTINLFNESFRWHIESLNIEEYFKLIETLYNIFDNYCEYDMLINKCNNESNISNGDLITQRLYDIIVPNIGENLNAQNSLVDFFYNNIPTKDHGWFRFMVVFNFKKLEKVVNFSQNKYEIDFLKVSNLTELSTMLDEKLVWSIHEKGFVSEKAVDYFVHFNLTSFRQILHPRYWSDDNTPLKMYMEHTPEQLLNKGSGNTLMHLSKLIAESKDMIDFSILECFLKELEKHLKHLDFCYKVLRNLLLYCKHNASEDIKDKFSAKILKLNLGELKAYSALFNSCVKCTKIDDLIIVLFREVTSGDARIEERYVHEHTQFKHCEFGVRKSTIYYINYFCDQNLNFSLLKLLLVKNADISKEKPRYFENSKEHRFKLRIAVAILQLFQCSERKYWSEDYWKSILEQNNQLNVTYLYERIIAYSAPNMEEIMKYLNKVSEYSASQQVSIVVICFAYIEINWHKIANAAKQKVLEKILPLTMGANFQARTYSQLAIYKLLERSQHDGPIISYPDQLLTAIRLTFGDQLTELLNDIRFDVKNILDYEIVLFVTNTPFDETAWISEDIKKKYAKCKELFCKKLYATQKANLENNSNVEAIDLQRKVNPVTDIIPDNNLISYPNCKENKAKENNVIVVATLINKLPNLGGIARTCEVLGINNLVLNSNKYIESSEFKNLSMTAEKSLVINEVKSDSLMEFLLQKKIEGFKIVGAEQTSKSESFVDFKFPKKCIILLGHEKEGIPANLLSILDHTVEIPQFGLVRSLNVHVTGAIFMWEYCKQHIV